MSVWFGTKRFIHRPLVALTALAVMAALVAGCGGGNSGSGGSGSGGSSSGGGGGIYGGGVKASLLGTIKRTDGTTQVTYNKHPLYYYSGDSQAGQQNGQGLNAFGALWYVVGPAGNQVT